MSTEFRLIEKYIKQCKSKKGIQSKPFTDIVDVPYMDT